MLLATRRARGRRCRRSACRSEIVVVVRVPGAVVRRLAVRGVHARRSHGVLDVVCETAATSSSASARERSAIVLRRRGRVARDASSPEPRELLPGHAASSRLGCRRALRGTHPRDRRARGPLPRPYRVPLCPRARAEEEAEAGVGARFERGGCSHATGASLRSTLPTAPLLRRACTLHDDGARRSASLTWTIGRVWSVDGTLASGGPNAAPAAGTRAEREDGGGEEKPHARRILPAAPLPVPPTGFEPVLTALKGPRPGPLVDGGGAAQATDT